MAVKANIVIDQGTDFSATVNVSGSDGVNPFDLTGYTVAAQMRKNYASSSASTFGTSHAGNTGVITLTMDNANTAGLEPGRYLYDVEITKTSDGEITRVVEGIVTVTPGITRI